MKRRRRNLLKNELGEDLCYCNIKCWQCNKLLNETYVEYDDKYNCPIGVNTIVISGIFLALSEENIMNLSKKYNRGES